MSRKRRAEAKSDITCTQEPQITLDGIRVLRMKKMSWHDIKKAKIAKRTLM